jgi:hypothetical protein
VSADPGLPATAAGEAGIDPVGGPPVSVVIRDEGAWSMDLRRPGRLELIGWAISGQVTAGNHTGADLIVPENRVDRGQVFVAQNYFTAFVRGERARVSRVTGRDVLLKRGDQMLEGVEDLEQLQILIARRDPRDMVDFTLKLSFPVDGPALPRPRARLLALALDDLNRGLFSWGLPAGESRPLRLGAISLRARWTDGGARLEDYLESYRLPDGGFRELYVLEGPASSGRYRTAPEDGSPMTLPAGSLVVSGNLVYRVER